MQQSRVSKDVRRLVESGYAVQSTDPSDRRAVRLELTGSGRRQAAAMRRDLLKAAAELIEPLPEERRAAMAAALDELQVLLPGRTGTRPTSR